MNKKNKEHRCRCATRVVAGVELDPREAASLLGVSERTVRRLMLVGDLLFERTCEGCRIRRDDLLLYRARRERADEVLRSPSQAA